MRINSSEEEVGGAKEEEDDDAEEEEEERIEMQKSLYDKTAHNLKFNGRRGGAEFPKVHPSHE